MQFASGGELYEYVSERKVLSDNDARRLFRQIATAVYYCHKVSKIIQIIIMIAIYQIILLF